MGSKLTHITLATVAVLCAIGLITFIFVGFTGPRADYRQAVGGYLDNAESAQTPEQFIQHLGEARDGISTLGLGDGDYGAYFDFAKTPDRSITYVFAQLDNLTQRAHEVIAWRDAMLNQSVTGEAFGDVYDDKMNALQDAVGDQLGDIIADAYYVENALWWYFDIYAVVILIPFSTSTGMIALVMGGEDDFDELDFDDDL